jgi:8-oxo-dGTP pyrophosphatase MutT (NUDIX family)
LPGNAFADRVRQALAAREPIRARGEPLRAASVLLPFFAPTEGAPAELWLVRRPDDMRMHGGQVALPGGKYELEDADLLSTALREAQEEIGLDPAEVEVLGAIDDCVTVTGFAVTPYVGWIARPFQPRPHAPEVARVFSAPLAAFQVPPREMSVMWGSSERLVLSYEAAGEIVWGATAAILRNFVELIA